MTARSSYLLLCGIGVLCFFSYNLVRMPILSLYAQALGAAPEAIGVIVSASTLTGVLLKLPAGALSDLYGRHRLLKVGALAFGVPPFCYPFVSDTTTLTALRFVHGLATALFAPAALAAVAELYRERRGAALGTYTAFTQVGSLLGPVLGGWLFHHLGFVVAFITAGVVGSLASVCAFCLRLSPPPRPRRPQGLPPVAADMLRGLREVTQNKRLLVTGTTDAAKMIANGALMAFLPIYGVSVGLNPGEVGLLFGVQSLTSFVSKPIMGRISDRVGRTPLILAGLGLCASTFVAIPLVSGFPALLGLAIGFGYGEAIVTSSTSALVADLSAVNTLGAGMGLLGMISDIGHASGPVVAGFLIASMGYQRAFAIIAAVQLGAAALFGVIMREPSSNQRKRVWTG
jgi:MFS family permease